MSEPKGTRQVLVFDVDEAFVSLLQNILGVYGFQVQAENPHSDKVHMVDLLTPDIIFITVDTPDMFGYTIYDKVRKIVKDKIPVALVTETLSPSDFAMHKQLKLPADIYLDKRHFSRADFLDQISRLIGFNFQSGTFLTEEKGVQTHETLSQEIPAGEDRFDQIKGHPAASLGTQDMADAIGSQKQGIPDHVDLSQRQKMGREESTGSKGDRWLSDLESKTHQLLQQLEKARHEMKSSGYSKHLPSERDLTNLENGQFIHLKEILHESDQEILADRNKLRELDEQMSRLKSEIEKGIERRREIVNLMDLKQNMEERIRKAEEIVIQERLAHQATQKGYESKIAELQGIIQKTEEKNQVLLRSAEERYKSKLRKEQEDRQHVYDSATKRYAAQLAQIRSEFEEIAKNANEKVQKAKETLAQERQNHSMAYENFKSKLSEIKEAIIVKEKQHQSLLHDAEKKHKKELHVAKKAVKEIKNQYQSLLRDAEEKHKANFLRAADKYNRIVESIVSKYAKNLAQLRIDLDKEKRAHQETQHKLEAKTGQTEE